MLFCRTLLNTFPGVYRLFEGVGVLGFVGSVSAGSRMYGCRG